MQFTVRIQQMHTQKRWSCSVETSGLGQWEWGETYPEFPKNTFLLHSLCKGFVGFPGTSNNMPLSNLQEKYIPGSVLSSVNTGSVCGWVWRLRCDSSVFVIPLKYPQLLWILQLGQRLKPKDICNQRPHFKNLTSPALNEQGAKTTKGCIYPFGSEVEHDRYIQYQKVALCPVVRVLCVTFLVVPAWIYAGLKWLYNHRLKHRNRAELAFISVL